MLKAAEEFPRPINVANVITRSNGQPASAGDADLENTRSRGGTIADAQSRAQRSTDDGPARDGSAGGSRLLSAGGRTCVCPVAVTERSVVEQAPIFTGPGPCLRQPNEPAPAAYSYVGHVFTGYPYGEYGIGGCPRGFYSPYLGYPYAEPYAPVPLWRHRPLHYSRMQARRTRAVAFAR